MLSVHSFSLDNEALLSDYFYLNSNGTDSSVLQALLMKILFSLLQKQLQDH